jgi:hypothetical protein
MCNYYYAVVRWRDCEQDPKHTGSIKKEITCEEVEKTGKTCPNPTEMPWQSFIAKFVAMRHAAATENFPNMDNSLIGWASAGITPQSKADTTRLSPIPRPKTTSGATQTLSASLSTLLSLYGDVMVVRSQRYRINQLVRASQTCPEK